MAQARRGTGTRKAGQGSKWIRPAKRFAIYARDGFCCAYCGAKAEEGVQLTLDHLVPRETADALPRARLAAALPGGPNHESNLVTCCLSCNSAKRDLSIRAWYAALTERGIDTRRIGRSIRRAVVRPLDIAEGKRLVALRK